MAVGVEVLPAGESTADRDELGFHGENLVPKLARVGILRHYETSYYLVVAVGLTAAAVTADDCMPAARGNAGGDNSPSALAVRPVAATVPATPRGPDFPVTADRAATGRRTRDRGRWDDSALSPLRSPAWSIIRQRHAARRPPALSVVPVPRP